MKAIMDKAARIYVAGHTGMVGSAIFRKLQRDGYQNIITRTSTELDLRQQIAVHHFFETEHPEYVFLAAGKVGGIAANNQYRAEFLYDNIMLEANIVHASYRANVTKLLFLGSSCIYPKFAPQPLKEEYLLSGYLEPTNQPYAIAKIAGIELCDSYRAQYGCNYISVMPTNLYGPNDHYDLKNSHVLPSLLRKFITAERNGYDSVELWGTGKPKREFMHVDDLADACVFLMNTYNEQEILNIGTGKDISILELAVLIKAIVGFKGNIHFDTTAPNGTPRKQLDVTKLNTLGWKAKINLKDGIQQVYDEIKEINWSN